MEEQPKRRALLALNPYSRNGAIDLTEARACLQDAGIEVRAISCDRKEDLSPRILAQRGLVDCVVIAGGDGTLNAAAAGLLATGLPLGLLPLGTANDFARSVDVPLDPVAAARVIAAGHLRRVDIGDVNGFAFFNVASVGLAADLAKDVTRERKRRFGRLSYALTALQLLARARPFHATLVTEREKVMVKTMQIAIGNGRYYGGGNVVSHQARIDDGELDLYSLEFRQVWRMALLAGSFQAGTHGAARDVRTARGRAFEVITRRPRSVNADGELVTQTPARFTQKPRALSVYVPGPASGNMA